ncbi:MAG: hypothetical protein OXE78_12855, partial [Gammaproteobacteria bacterium]|nr:hypothetical protein [Gammaproteobacteria bacterium]
MPRTSTAFREYLKDFANHGILDTEQDEFDQRIVRIRIYPTISELLSGNMIEKVAGYLMAENMPVVEKSEEDEIEEKDPEQGSEQS